MLIWPKPDQGTFTGIILGQIHFPNSLTISMLAKTSAYLYSLRYKYPKLKRGCLTYMKKKPVLYCTSMSIQMWYKFQNMMLIKMLLLLHCYPAHYRCNSKAGLRAAYHNPLNKHFNQFSIHHTVHLSSSYLIT